MNLPVGELAMGIVQILLGAGSVLGIFFILGPLWIRVKAKGRLYAHFVEETGYVTGETVKLGVSGDAELFTSKQGGQYTIVGSPRSYIYWPPGYPSFMQFPIPYQRYFRNTADPIDADQPMFSKTSANALSMLQDEAFIRATWQDAKEGLVGSNKKFGLPIMTWLVIVAGGAFVCAAVAAFYGFKIIQELEIMRTLGGL